jgi:hypothetical protein
MAATPTHDLCIKTRTYSDRTTGEEKAAWLKIGTVFKHDDGGTSIKLDCVPVGLPGWEGWVSVFKKQDKDGQGYSQGGQGGAQRPPQGNGQGYGQRPPQGHQGTARQPEQPSQWRDDDIPF